MAGGAPIRDEVADEAAAWLTRFMAGEVDDAARARWQQWRNSHPDHERAWRHIEAVSARLRGLDPGAACHSLAQPRKSSHNAARRRLLGFAGGLTVLGGAGLLIGRGVGPIHELAADHRTAVGERREVTLADGSHIQLNTASAIDVRFSPDARVVRLRAGEIHVTTAEDVGAARPFLVETGHGTIRALGTRFTVRRHDDHTEVAVYQHAVEIMPADAPTAMQRLQRGEAMNFTRGRAGPRILADAQATAQRRQPAPGRLPRGAWPLPSWRAALRTRGGGSALFRRISARRPRPHPGDAAQLLASRRALADALVGDRNARTTRLLNRDAARSPGPRRHLSGRRAQRLAECAPFPVDRLASARDAATRLRAECCPGTRVELRSTCQCRIVRNALCPISILA